MALKSPDPGHILFISEITSYEIQVKNILNHQIGLQ